MSVQDSGADLVQCCLDCLDLADDVNTILVFFEHPLDAPDVTFDGFQPLDIFMMVVLHDYLL
jgi:hypothetical protein